MAEPVHQLLLLRIGVFHFGAPSRYVRKAMNVLPHHDVPLMRPNFGGMTLYNRRFISKLYLDSALGLGLYRPTPDTVSLDATVIFEIEGMLFCATVNEVNTIINVPDREVKPIAELPLPLPSVFPSLEFMQGYVDQKHRHIFILDIAKLHQANFLSPPNRTQGTHEATGIAGAPTFSQPD